MALAVMCGLVAIGRASIDPKNFDFSVKPRDDFNQFANGGWMKANPIPPAYSRWGAFNEVDENNKVALHALLERAAKAGQPSAIEKKVGDFYASGMDLTAIDATGIAPLQPELDRIGAIKTPVEVQAAIAHLHRRNVHAGFFFTSEQDPKNSAMMIAAGGQAGLGLPDRDYYLRDDEKSKKLREQYVAHVGRMLVLSGFSPAAAEAGAQTVMKLETALAKASKTNVELRDPVANYHKLTQAELQQLDAAVRLEGVFCRHRPGQPRGRGHRSAGIFSRLEWSAGGDASGRLAGLFALAPAAFAGALSEQPIGGREFRLFRQDP